MRFYVQNEFLSNAPLRLVLSLSLNAYNVLIKILCTVVLNYLQVADAVCLVQQKQHKKRF